MKLHEDADDLLLELEGLEPIPEPLELEPSATATVARRASSGADSAETKPLKAR